MFLETSHTPIALLRPSLSTRLAKSGLKNFKFYVAMRHGRKAMDKLFWDIQALVVRTIRAVDRLVIHDMQSFEVLTVPHDSVEWASRRKQAR